MGVRQIVAGISALSVEELGTGYISESDFYDASWLYPEENVPLQK